MKFYKQIHILSTFFFLIFPCRFLPPSFCYFCFIFSLPPFLPSLSSPISLLFLHIFPPFPSFTSFLFLFPSFFPFILYPSVYFPFHITHMPFPPLLSSPYFFLPFPPWFSPLLSVFPFSFLSLLFCCPISLSLLIISFLHFIFLFLLLPSLPTPPSFPFLFLPLLYLIMLSSKRWSAGPTKQTWKINQEKIMFLTPSSLLLNFLFPLKPNHKTPPLIFLLVSTFFLFPSYKHDKAHLLFCSLPSSYFFPALH